MIAITATGIKEVQAMLETYPKQASRACERALDATGRQIKKDVREEMVRVFDRPVPYTLNSLQLTPTHNHNMVAKVWFKEPERMQQHYLVPQVEGGQQKLKGFERALAMGEMLPTRIGAKLNSRGNMSVGQIRQILSVLGRAEGYAGFTANMSVRSSRRNTKERDFVMITRSQRGNLPLGVYQRFAQAGREINAKTARKFGAKGARSYQFGRSKGKWQSIVRSRGLRPVLLATGKRNRVRPLLDFYGVAGRTFDATFVRLFSAYLSRGRQ